MLLILSFFWFYLIWSMSRPEEKFPIIFKYGYLVIILLTELLLFTNPWHGLVWQGFWVADNNLLGVRGILIWSECIGLPLCIYTVYLNFHWIFTSRGTRQKQAIWVLVAESISFAGITSDTFFFTHTIPWVTLITTACMMWCLYRWQLYSIPQLVQSAVLADIVDGCLVVDEYGYIMYVNHAAKKILWGLSVHVGGEFTALTKAWPLLGKATEGECKTVETFRDYTYGRCYYKIKKLLLEKNEPRFGQIILFEDITLKKKAGLIYWNKKKKELLQKNG